MGSLKGSLLKQLPRMSSPSPGSGIIVGGVKGTCSLPAATSSCRVLKLDRRVWTRDMAPLTGEASSSRIDYTSGRRRPGSPTSSLLFAGDPSLLLGRPECSPSIVHLHQVQQNSPPAFCVSVIRPPLEPSPDVKPSLNPFSPSIPDPNLPSPPPSTTPPEFLPDDPPSEFPTPSNPEPEVAPSTPLEVPVTDPIPEFSPTTIPSPEIPTTPSEFPSERTPSQSPISSVPPEIPTLFSRQIYVNPNSTELPLPGVPPEVTVLDGEIRGSAVPRGPPIMPPNTPPIVPPGTPQPIPPPVIPPITPPGTAPPIPLPQTPPILPGMPGPVPPPTQSPGQPSPPTPPLSPDLQNIRIRDMDS